VEWMAASTWILLFVGVCQCIYPLSNSLLLWLCESGCCVPVMPRYRRICPSDEVVMARILQAVRLQFNRLPVGVDDERISRIYRRGLRWRSSLGSPWVGRAARRIRILRNMTQFRTSGAGKLCFEFDFVVWVLLSKGVYCIPISLTLFLSLSLGGVADLRSRFCGCVPCGRVGCGIASLGGGDVGRNVGLR
jgi:hypothetical protein